MPGSGWQTATEERGQVVNSSKVTIRLAAVPARSLPGQVEAKCGRPEQCQIGGTLVPLIGRNALLPWSGRDHDGGNKEARAGIPGVPESGEEDQR